MPKPTKQLRFASLVRVSTEAQEEKQSSLLDQEEKNRKSVKALGGTITAEFHGQEHATEGADRKLMDALLAECQKPTRRFDAVIVNDHTRWYRDNVRNETSLRLVREHKVRYFIGQQEQDLWNEQVFNMLRFQGLMNSMTTEYLQRRSLEVRIADARKGKKTVSKVPYGRSYDKATWTFGILEDRKALIEEVARRYLKGESLGDLAKFAGLHRSALHKILRHESGDTWQVEFQSARLNLFETVAYRVPALLGPQTIKAVHARMDANKTYLHGHPKHAYLLSGRIFCGVCGYHLVGKTNGYGYRYYRHPEPHERKGSCPIRPLPTIPADRVERDVVEQLFGMFGNPAQVERVVRAAIPDEGDSGQERQRLETRLSKVKTGRQKILSLIARDLLSEDEAAEQLQDSRQEEADLQTRLDGLAAACGERVDPVAVRKYVERFQWGDGSTSVVVTDGECTDCDGLTQINQYSGGNDIGSRLLMTYEDKQKMIQAVFHAPLPDGSPGGVYVYRDGDAKAYRPKQWCFKVRGRLDFEFVLKSLTDWSRTRSSPMPPS
jgi:hypothetical protein